MIDIREHGGNYGGGTSKIDISNLPIQPIAGEAVLITGEQINMTYTPVHIDDDYIYGWYPSYTFIIKLDKKTGAIITTVNLSHPIATLIYDKQSNKFFAYLSNSRTIARVDVDTLNIEAYTSTLSIGDYRGIVTDLADYIYLACSAYVTKISKTFLQGEGMISRGDSQFGSNGSGVMFLPNKRLIAYCNASNSTLLLFDVDTMSFKGSVPNAYVSNSQYSLSFYIDDVQGILYSCNSISPYTTRKYFVDFENLMSTLIYAVDSPTQYVRHIKRLRNGKMLCMGQNIYLADLEDNTGTKNVYLNLFNNTAVGVSLDVVIEDNKNSILYGRFVANSVGGWHSAVVGNLN